MGFWVVREEEYKDFHRAPAVEGKSVFSVRFFPAFFTDFDFQ